MVDWSQAFDRLSHKLGIQSSIENGVRPSLISILSQTKRNTYLIDLDDKLKFMDDLSVLEIINLISQGLTSFNFKSHVV